VLERLQLRNFQRHEDFRVVFDERVTTIVGRSDVGKSSILRALRWLMLGRPSGSAFVRHGRDEAMVSLWLDGHKLSRRKGRRTNKLALDGVGLEAFGMEMPETVALLCNVDETNFQTQHESPFWLSLTAGQASRELNAVVNLGVIDKALSAVAAKARRAKAAADLSQERCERCEKQLESLDWVEEMSRDWQWVENLQKRQDESERKIIRAKALRDEANRLRRQAAMEVPDTTELDTMVSELEKREQVMRSALTQLTEVRHLTRTIESCKEGVNDLEVRLSTESGGICPLCGSELEN